MTTRMLAAAAAALSLLPAGCVVDQRDFETLREQVRVQQRQINDLKIRQEEQDLRVDTLNDGFKIISDTVEENARRLDDQFEPGPVVAPPAAVAPAVEPAPVRPTEPVPAPTAVPALVPVPTPAPVARPEQPPAPAPAPPPLPATRPEPTPAPPPAQEPILLTNRPQAAKPEPAPAPPPARKTVAASPERMYANALTLYSRRSYREAEDGFGRFIDTYPDHVLAGNAQYWIGESLYSQRRMPEAAEEFAKVEKLYPSSPKIPAAMYKTGLSLMELKKWPEARAAFQRVIERYPQTEEAGKARERLDSMR